MCSPAISAGLPWPISPALGVRRVSVGGALARMAWAGVMRAGKDLAAGRLDAFDDAASGAELNRFFTADADRRE